MIAAVVATTLVLAPRKFSALAVDGELVALAAAGALVVLVNVYLLRHLIGPIQSLTALARRVDLNRPGERMPRAEADSEAGELALAINEMLSRLERERREATGRILAAQEGERLRIAQELHDQVGQELTAVLLGLSRLEARAPATLQPQVLMIQDVVRASLDDLRRLAVELRPEALDELGLASALAVLAQRLIERLGLEVRADIAPDLPDLPAETELVVYRVAQEALTNVARHSGSDRAEVTLSHRGNMLTLIVLDEGRGLSPGVEAGTGMRGMRERAALSGATLWIRNRVSRSGCEVRLDIPLEDRA
jgi:two-component system sensor histidine kinase UhpB